MDDNITNITIKNMADITIRMPASGDYERLAECIAEARGANYYSPQYYNADYLAGGNDELFAAYDSAGELVGFTGISRGLFDDERSLLSLLNVRPGFTGYGIARELLRLSVEKLNERGVRAVKGHVVTKHASVQRVLENLGLEPAGFLYGVRDGKNSRPVIHGKCALGLYVRNISVKDVGIIYAHSEIADLARRIYGGLNVRAAVETSVQLGGMESKSVMKYYYDAHDSVIFVQVLECGSDTAEKLDKLFKQYARSDTFTATVLLSLCSPSAICGYEKMRGMGLAFCGFDPLGQHEHAVFFGGYPCSAEMVMTKKLEKFVEELLYVFST